MMRSAMKLPNCLHILQFDVALNCFQVTVFTSQSFLLNLLPSCPPSNATFFIYLERMGADWSQPTHQTSFVCLLAVVGKEK